MKAVSVRKRRKYRVVNEPHLLRRKGKWIIENSTRLVTEHQYRHEKFKSRLEPLVFCVNCSCFTGRSSKGCKMEVFNMFEPIPLNIFPDWAIDHPTRCGNFKLRVNRRGS